MKDALLVTKREFASYCGITPEAITKWDSRNFRECYDGTKISLPKAIRYLYAWKKELDESTSCSDASEQKKYWDAQRSKVTYLQMIDELVPKLEYLQTEKERFLLFRSGVMSLSDQLAPELNLSPEQKQLVTQKCRALIQSLKETFRGREKEWNDLINSPMESLKNDSPE